MTLQRFTNCSIENKQLNGMVAHPAKPNIYAKVERKMHTAHYGDGFAKFQELSQIECTNCDNWEQWDDDLTKCDLQGFSLLLGKLRCDICGSLAQ